MLLEYVTESRTERRHIPKDQELSKAGDTLSRCFRRDWRICVKKRNQEEENSTRITFNIVHHTETTLNLIADFMHLMRPPISDIFRRLPTDCLPIRRQGTVSEELAVERIRDEIIWSLYANSDQQLGYFILVP